ncbi:tyrosine-type recombinase/integrase [Virgibacillus salexigens]|uniref:tyrosine-type recombinase/integrase n=1 Tax=Virgibacillus salexigens TaxID=61016 RepID=UPI00190B473D|nr:site-specific integrase [Virgibacillus salexigens]
MRRIASLKEIEPGKYKLYVELGYDENGKRLRKTKTVKATGPRQANKMLTEFAADVYSTGIKNIKDISFESFVGTWKEEHANKNLSASTLESYVVLLNSSILPQFGKKLIKNITTLQLVKFFNKEKEKGDAVLVRKYYVLQSIFKKAFEWEVIERNPMDNVDKPKYKQKKKDFYNKKEMELMFEKLGNLLPHQQTIVKLAIVGGMRRGEILAITEKEINGNELLIHRSLQHTKDKGLVLKPTKTGEERTITLPDGIIQELLMLHERQLEREKDTGNLWEGFNNEIMIFANEFGKPFTPHSVTRFWNRFVEREKLKKISFHDLRHSSASLLISEGVNMKVVQTRLGHKDITTTMNIYSHVTKTDDEKASDIFSDFVK